MAADLDSALAAAQAMHEIAFAYTDSVADRVITEYEAEREQWVASRTAARADTLRKVLNGGDVDMGETEFALGYGLRQHHLGVVLWGTKPGDSADQLKGLEALSKSLSAVVGGVGRPLFVPRDGGHGWAWLPLGRTARSIDPAAIESACRDASDSFRVAVGTPRSAVDGFRLTHHEARRAYRVASVADDRARIVTNFADPDVKTASLLASDVESTRQLVLGTLGPLAADDPAVELLRETLLDVMAAGGKLGPTAERMHLHRNTVYHRIQKAVALRGRAIEAERLNLHLALVACRWLGEPVLT